MRINNYDSFITNFTKLKKSFKVRETSNYVEIVHTSGKKAFHNKNGKFIKGLFIFRMVKNDVLNWLKNNDLKVYRELPVNFFNDEFDKKNKVIGIDIDNAYWSIAYLKDYITEKTYLKGIENKDFKAIRLSALSMLGKSKVYKVYVNGEYVNDEVKNYNETLQEIYRDIRYSTYGILYEISEILQNDFYCWKTDCIFFKDTKKNRKIVKTHIESYGLTCKLEQIEG